jgi:hypothetical protein
MVPKLEKTEGGGEVRIQVRRLEAGKYQQSWIFEPLK